MEEQSLLRSQLARPACPGVICSVPLMLLIFRDGRLKLIPIQFGLGQGCDTCRVPLLLLIVCKRRFKAYSNKVRSGPGNNGMLEYWVRVKILNPNIPSLHLSMSEARVNNSETPLTSISCRISGTFIKASHGMVKKMIHLSPWLAANRHWQQQDHLPCDTR